MSNKESHEKVQPLNPDDATADMVGFQNKNLLPQDELEVIMQRLIEWREEISRTKIDPPLTAGQVLQDTGVLDNESYYLGSSTSDRDVNGEILMRMYYLLALKQNQQAANDFVSTIERLDLLPAKVLIRTIHALASNSWSPVSDEREKEIVKTVFGTESPKPERDKEDYQTTEIIKLQFTQLLYASGDFPVIEPQNPDADY